MSLNAKRIYEHKSNPIGNAGTDDEPYVIAYMNPTAFELEITGTRTTLHPEPGFRGADRWGSIEVEVRFRRWFDPPKTFLEDTRVEGDRPLGETLVKPSLHLSAAQECIPYGLRGKVLGAIRLAEYASSQAGRNGYDREGGIHYLALAAQELEKAGRMADFPAEFWEELLRAVEWLGLIEERNRIVEFVGSTTLAAQQTLSQGIRFLENARWLPFRWDKREALPEINDLVIGRLDLAVFCIGNAKRHQDRDAYFHSQCILAAEELEHAGQIAGFAAQYWQELLLAVEWLGLIQHRNRIRDRLAQIENA